MEGRTISHQFALPRILWGVGLLCLLVTACASRFEETRVADIPVKILRTDIQEIDLDMALEAAKGKAREVLPEAYFQRLVFSGKCRDLPRFQGTLVLVFEQVSSTPFKRQVIIGIASIDTVRQTMNLHFWDESDYELHIPQRTFVGTREFTKIASLAHSYITELGLDDCDVTLTQMDNSWDVRCGPLGNFVQKCRFEIADGVIRPKQ